MCKECELALEEELNHARDIGRLMFNLLKTMSKDDGRGWWIVIPTPEKIEAELSFNSNLRRKG